MGTAIKHPVPDRVKLSFVIFDIRALWRSGVNFVLSIAVQWSNSTGMTLLLAFRMRSELSHKYYSNDIVCER